VTELAKRKVAAFDFDGTLSDRDTLIPFLLRVTGRSRFAQIVAQIGVSGLSRGVNLRDRDAVKAEMIHRVMCGRSEEDLQRLGRLYARDLLVNELNPMVLQRLQQHRDAGHELLFVSASLTYYLTPLADELGVNAVIAVEPTVEYGLLTGAMNFPNVRAEQKALRLRSWLNQPVVGPMRNVELWSYGNSSGDHALLEMADHAYWLGKQSKLPIGAQMLPPRSAPFETA
jgi:phosphatidylglycerophosphatase C